MKHSPDKCPYLHVKDCEGCGRSCWCFKKPERKKVKPVESSKNKALDELMAVAAKHNLGFKRKGYILSIDLNKWDSK